MQTMKEKKHIEERNADLLTKIASEEDKGRHIDRIKNKYETQSADLEEQLHKERQVMAYSLLTRSCKAAEL